MGEEAKAQCPTNNQATRPNVKMRSQDFDGTVLPVSVRSRVPKIEDIKEALSKVTLQANQVVTKDKMRCATGSPSRKATMHGTIRPAV